MKIIDNNGRIFGKINIIDIAIVLFLIIFIAMFIYSYQLITRQSIHDTSKILVLEQKTVVLNVKTYGVNEKTLKIISIGDKAIDSKGKTVGEIINIGKLKKINQRPDIKMGYGKLLIVEDTVLNLKLRLLGEVRKNRFYYQNQLVGYDSPFIFKTGKYSLRVMPTLEKVIKTKMVKVKVRSINVIPEVANLVNSGDKEYLLTDPHKVLATVVSVVKNVPSTQFIIAEGKKSIKIIQDHILRDVSLILLLKVKDKQGYLFYKNTPIKVGERFILSTNNYTLNCQIIEILS